MKKLFVNGLIAAILTITSVAIFDGCKKDNREVIKSPKSISIQKNDMGMVYFESTDVFMAAMENIGNGLY